MTCAAAIAAALNGQPAGDGRFLCSCPVSSHGKGRGDRNPSLCVSDGDEAILVTCFGGCDRADVIAELRHRGLLHKHERRNQPHRRHRPKPTTPSHFELSLRNENLEIARRIWHEETKPLNGTIGASYFTVRRGIDLDTLPDLNHCLRWHEAKRMIVALMRDPVTGDELGIHRVILNADGTKRERKMLGPAGIVFLTSSENVELGLGLSEGLEDGLSLMSNGWRPIWAAPTAGAIRSFPVLAGIECITIWADNDATGKAAARTCAKRWLNQGQEAEIRLPAQS